MSVKLFQSAALGVAALAVVCAWASGDVVTKSAVSPAVGDGASKAIGEIRSAR